MIGKAQKAVNTVWGVIKRAKIDTSKKRLLLMDSLVKGSALCSRDMAMEEERGNRKVAGKICQNIFRAG